MECFFCFQAEDGIRDLTVTGVQTCALPIWHRGGDAAQQDQSEQREEERGPPAHCRSALRSTQLMPSGRRNFVTVSTLSLTPLNQSSWLHRTPYGRRIRVSTVRAPFRRAAPRGRALSPALSER